MAEANKEVPVDETVQKNEHPKDLLQRFSPEENPKENTQLAVQPDLNLRLSLGGIYGENSKEKTLTRSSSIVGVLTLNKETGELDAPLPKSSLSLARSSSLPTEAEKEHRNAILREFARRRVEAAQRLMRQRSARGSTEKEQSPASAPETMPSSPSKVAASTAASAAKSPTLRRAIFKIKTLALLSGTRKAEESHAAGSESLPNQKDASGNGKAVKHGKDKPENPSKKAKFSHGCFQDDGMDVMRQMPTVTTTGNGPNGRKIEGFLYKYRKGQVSIVCVCHGSFLSPAEFVKHAGGEDVRNPMKHITVCSTSFSF